jgi:predicted ATPase
MLTSITIKDFRTFKDVTIPLKPITVFIGPNNSGKTNAIRALQLMTTVAATGQWPDEVGDQARKAGFFLEVRGEFHDASVKLTLGGPSHAARFGRASVQVGGSTGPKMEFGGGLLRTGSQKPNVDAARYFMDAVARAPAPALAEFFKDARVASLSVPKLREPAAISKEPILGERGENFGAVLDWLSGKRPALFRAINEELKRVLGVDGCTTLVTEAGLKIPAIIEGDQSFGADVISDGVLLYIGLTTVGHLVGPNSLLIIEEPENGIHPRRLKYLLEQIRAIAKRGTQVILTTHSPILLDEFRDEAESIVVFERDAEGTHVKQLSPEHLKEVLNGDVGLGALWFSGAIGGVPA